MDLTLASRGKWTVVQVRGRLDAFNYGILSSRLSTLRKAGKTNIALDMSDAPAISISTANLLLKYAPVLREAGGSLAVITSLPRTQEVLNLFNDSASIIIHPRLEDLDSLEVRA